ncbi:MAG: hypothetical protein ACFFA3_07710 [Promethearchaeota archaeon]
MFYRRIRKYKHKFIYLILIIFLSSTITLKISDLASRNVRKNGGQKLNISSTKSCTAQLLKDCSFDSPLQYWNSTIEGDFSDVNSSLSPGEVHYNIRGEHKTFSFLSNPVLNSTWDAVPNLDYPSFPDFYGIGKSGAWVSHYWREGPDQSVAVNWDTNLTIPVDMSDYVITSANISSIVNGSVATFSADPPDYSDGIDTANDGCEEFSMGDYVRFYVKISDLEKSKKYEIAHFQTTDLGQDSGPEIEFLYDTQLIPITEESLIIYLTSVLNSDNHNFTLTIGMRIWCEDNFPQDSDWWKLLRIKSVNLTFTYEKKINKFTTLSWNQITGKINDLSHNNIELIDAKLNFKYKLEDEWPTSLSPNSEIRILVNNNKLLETIKFIENNFTTDFQEAKPGGFNIKTLISEEENVSVAIELYLADEFTLPDIITITLDDVIFEVSYKEIIPEKDFSLLIIFTLLFVVIGILGALSLRSYIFLPHHKKRETYLMLRTQKFKDIRNIQGIILIHRESGLPIFSKEYSSLIKSKKTLFSGFIQAISIIGEEISQEDPSNIDKIKSLKKIDSQKVIELDLKQFFCLILDIEELRSVLILKSRSSKRLKQTLFNFTLASYLKISKSLKDFDNDVTEYSQLISPLLDEYFDLFYKDSFITEYANKDLQNIKKKYRLSKIQVHILEKIFLILEEKRTFRLMDIIEEFRDKNEDLIIDGLEKLIEQRLILPYGS